MRKKLTAFLIISSVLVTSSVMAANAVKVYGIAHVAIESTSETGKANDLNIKSKSSRLGFKGGTKFKGGLQGIYKFEFQIDMADNNGGNAADIFIKSRNMYVGLKDKNLGTLLVGRHDSAMKKAIGIKIFSDTVAEMTTVMGKNVKLYNRSNNTLYYASPKIGSIQVLVSVTTLEDNTDKALDMKSFAVTYKTKRIYVGLANESLNAGQKGSRVTFGYKFKGGHQVGVGYEAGKHASGDDHKAFVVNGVFKLSNLYKIKATYGMREDVKDETAFGVAFIRDLGDKSELYLLYHANKDENNTNGVPSPFDKNTVSLGMKYVF